MLNEEPQQCCRPLVDGGISTCFTNPGTSMMHFVAAPRGHERAGCPRSPPVLQSVEEEVDEGPDAVLLTRFVDREADTGEHPEDVFVVDVGP